LDRFDSWLGESVSFRVVDLKSQVQVPDSSSVSLQTLVLEKPPVVQLLVISKNFMEPEGLLQYSQEPATGPIQSQINPIHTTQSDILEEPF
jgi:hypothetical protein